MFILAISTWYLFIIKVNIYNLSLVCLISSYKSLIKNKSFSLFLLSFTTISSSNPEYLSHS